MERVRNDSLQKTNELMVHVYAMPLQVSRGLVLSKLRIKAESTFSPNADPGASPSHP